tara:strand:+ start:5945 stop:6073 length:129 start_codon:yes stop_codon:yes gene_type:complete
MIRYYIAEANNGFKFYCLASNDVQAKEKQNELIAQFPELKRI